MTTYQMERADFELVAEVQYDEITAAAVKPFDLSPTDQLGFRPWAMPEQMPEDFGIGIIIGASGSGKSQFLEYYGGEEPVAWVSDRSIVSHFDTAEEGASKLYAVGLNAIPVWRKPYHVLSNGQQFRADLARRLGHGAIVDEFTSVVDRNVAMAASRAVRVWADREGVRQMVFATVHRDVVPWLRPDWIIDTDTGQFTIGEQAEQPVWWTEHIRHDRGGLVGAYGMGDKPKALTLQQALDEQRAERTERVEQLCLV